MENLREEVDGAASLEHFSAMYPGLMVQTYVSDVESEYWHAALSGFDVVILHEWTTTELAQMLLALRPKLGYALVFHDTHHRALSSPEDLDRFGVRYFDGVIAFGEVLRSIYNAVFSITRLWVLHEAADVSLFKPCASLSLQQDLVWIGNWGDNERSNEIKEFLLGPVTEIPHVRTTVYGVRYPPEGVSALEKAGVNYGGYLPNLNAPRVYASSRLTVHIPRRYYATTMIGIPTIRVFEALACGIPLISAPWQDVEHLFQPGDFTFVYTKREMESAINNLLRDPARSQAQAQQGLATILARHTCEHRALELTSICNEILA